MRGDGYLNIPNGPLENPPLLRHVARRVRRMGIFERSSPRGRFFRRLCLL
jgi:hypothetical protein